MFLCIRWLSTINSTINPIDYSKNWWAKNTCGPVISRALMLLFYVNLNLDYWWNKCPFRKQVMGIDFTIPIYVRCENFQTLKNRKLKQKTFWCKDRFLFVTNTSKRGPKRSLKNIVSYHSIYIRPPTAKNFLDCSSEISMHCCIDNWINKRV